MSKNYVQSDNTIDVISRETEADYEAFFGPILDNAPRLVTEKNNMADILVELGLAESKTWARKNGWSKELPPGLSMHRFGKNRIEIWVFIKEVNHLN